MENLFETVSAQPVRKGKRWLVTIAKPGKGSSGTYSAELMESKFSQAFPAGTKSYWKHVNVDERDPRDMIGKFSETFWNAEEQKFQGYLDSHPRWDQVIEELGSDLGFSISAGGEKDDDGNVTDIYYSRANSVDGVAEPGLLGSRLESLVESARAGYDMEPSGKSPQEKERIMTEKLEQEFASLKGLVETFIASTEAKAKEDAQVVADEAAAKVAAAAAVEAYAANIALVEAAREALLPGQIADLQEEAKVTESAAFAASVEKAKKVTAEAKAAVLQESEVAGRSFVSSTVESAIDLGKVF